MSSRLLLDELGALGQGALRGLEVAPAERDGAEALEGLRPVGACYCCRSLEQPSAFLHVTAQPPEGPERRCDLRRSRRVCFEQVLRERVQLVVVLLQPVEPLLGRRRRALDVRAGLPDEGDQAGHHRRRASARTSRRSTTNATTLISAPRIARSNRLRTP